MGSCQNLSSDLSEAQKGPAPSLGWRFPGCRAWHWALMASCRWWVSALCNHSVARELLDSALVLPGSQLSAAVCHHALFLPFLSLLFHFLASLLLQPLDWLVNSVSPRPIVGLFTTHRRVCLHALFRYQVCRAKVNLPQTPAPETRGVGCRWSLQIHCLIGLNKEHVWGTHKASCCNINLQKEFYMWHFLNVSK